MYLVIEGTPGTSRRTRNVYLLACLAVPGIHWHPIPLKSPREIHSNFVDDNTVQNSNDNTMQNLKDNTIQNLNDNTIQNLIVF